MLKAWCAQSINKSTHFLWRPANAEKHYPNVIRPAIFYVYCLLPKMFLLLSFRLLFFVWKWFAYCRRSRTKYIDTKRKKNRAFFFRWLINIRHNIPLVRDTTSSFMGFHYSTISSKINYKSTKIDKRRLWSRDAQNACWVSENMVHLWAYPSRERKQWRPISATIKAGNPCDVVL